MSVFNRAAQGSMFLSAARPRRVRLAGAVGDTQASECPGTCLSYTDCSKAIGTASLSSLIFGGLIGLVVGGAAVYALKR